MIAPADLDALARAADPARADSRALSAFLAGPVKASALEASSPDAPDPANVQRRRWGVGGAASTAVAAASTTTSSAAAAPAPSTPGPSATTSWWQKTSWFAGASPDVDPVLADPTGADGGASGLSAPAPGAVGGAACQNRFTGPGQRDPIRPVTPGSVRVNPFDAAAVEDPGEVYGGHNARSGAAAAYRAVGGAMAHSRLSLQPRRSTPRGPRCADEFERGHPMNAAKTNGACAVASAAARPKYGFDFVRGVWEVEGTGAEVRARARRNQETTTTEGSDPSEDSSGVSGSSSASGSSSGDLESTRRALATAAKETRDARLTRFAAQHEAATEAARAARAFAAEARAARRALERKRKFASDARSSRPPSSVSPLEPSERASAREPPSAGAALAPAPKPAASSSWRMLRLGAAPELGPVFVDAGEDGDVSPATLARWVAGDAPWPEMRVMELSREARESLGVPAGAPGPVASPALADAARREIAALVAEAAAEANRAKDKDRSEDHSGGSLAAAASDSDSSRPAAPRRAPGPSSMARMPPGSTATPRQANIIDRLVEATGANRAALEDAAAARKGKGAGKGEGKGEGPHRGGGGGGGGVGGGGGGGEGAGEKATAALKDALRDAIREKHANLARAKNAEARVARLEAALASAGVPIPSDA